MTTPTAQLRQAITSLTSAEMSALLSDLPPEHRRALDDALHVRRGRSTDALVRIKLLQADPEKRQAAVSVLTDKLSQAAEELVGEERFAEPSADDLAEMVAHVEPTFGPAAVRLWLAAAVVAQVPAAPLCQELLDARAAGVTTAPPAADETSASDEAAGDDPADDDVSEPSPAE